MAEMGSSISQAPHFVLWEAKTEVLHLAMAITAVSHYQQLSVLYQHDSPRSPHSSSPRYLVHLHNPLQQATITFLGRTI